MADKIVVGSLAAPLYTFEGAKIDHQHRPLQLVLSAALSGDELAIDQLLPRVFSDAYIRVGLFDADGLALYDADGFRLYAATGANSPDQIPYATPLWYFVDGVLMGKFFTKFVVQVGPNAFDFFAMSPIGVLEGQNHTGGVYAGQSWNEVAAEIIGGAVPFTVADEVAAIPVFGWLPKASRRDNLHELLFAYGVMAFKDEGGDLLFRFPDTDTVKAVPDGRIFFGGAINYETPATRVEVAEHAFLKLPSDETEVLFDNTDGSGVADWTTVDFRTAPIHDLEASGSLVIHESSVNHAVLSGTGVLTGRRYTHTTKIIALDSGAVGENRTVSVTGRTLVNAANSQNVARRLLSFYGAARTISADLIVQGEKPGDLLSFNDPVGRPTTAFLASMDATSTSFIRAGCQLIANYTPAWGGNNYSNVVVLTGSGTWTHTGKVRAVLISGGQGGGSGCDGQTLSQDGTPEVSGKGGAAGAPGLGGRILSVELELNGSVSYSCGVGGLGGVNSGTESVAGEDGTDTTFGAYSTADGLRSQTGAVNLFTGEVLALPGADGIPGGDGGEWSADLTEYIAPTVTGSDGTIYTAGQPGERGGYYEDGKRAGGYGGLGGGAAAGGNGENGGDGYYQRNNVDAPDYYFVSAYGGPGGNGASALSPINERRFGFGGPGGNGGGGPGGGGEAFNEISPTNKYNGKPGDPGKGSDGGKAGDGCIIVYY